MTVFHVEPLIRVNGIEFGMDRKDVRKLYDNRYSEFRKTFFSKNTTDDFEGFHVYYDSNNKCEAVEIFEGDEVYVNGRKIMPGSAETLKNEFPDIVEEEGNYTSVYSSVGAYIEDGEIKSILFGNKGYYE